MSIFGKIWKGIKKVAKSPIVQVVAGGAALAFPVVGVPAVAALAISNKVLKAADAGGEAAAKAKALIKNTVAAANQGHPDAKRAVVALKLTQAARKGHPPALRRVAELSVRNKRRKAAAKSVANAYVLNKKNGRLVHRKNRHAPRGAAHRHH